MWVKRGNLALWDAEGDAVIINPDRPWKLVFWKNAQYVPCWDLGKNVWFTPEWMETGSPEGSHCYEPIMDKDCKYSRVDIVENGEARVKVHWHYALCNERYEIFHGNSTADEYYTIYPDGIAVRKLVGWPGNEDSHGLNPSMWEVGEFIIINGKGTHPEEHIIREPGFTLMNLEKEKVELEWPSLRGGPLCREYPQIAEWDEYIGVVHLKNSPNPFVAIVRNKLLFPYENCTACGKDHPEFRSFPGGSNYYHWPVYDRTDFDRWLVASPSEIGKMATHTSCVCFGYHYGGKTPPRPSSWLFLTGAYENSIDEARDWVASWLKVAKVKCNHLFEGYSFSERAYLFRTKSEEPFRIKITPAATIINPVFRINKYPMPIEITWNGISLERDEYKMQFDGEDLIIWINRRLEKETNLEIFG